MSLSHSPLIVRDGLVLCLDAANSRSYPKSGTTWSDLAGANNGTLTNGPTFDADDKGGIVFDGTNDYVNLGSSSSLFPGPSITATICCWVKSSVANSNIPIGNQWTLNQRLYIGIQETGKWDFGFGDYAWDGNNSGTRVDATTDYTFVSLVVNAGSASLYVNANKTITKTTDTSVSLGNITLGSYIYNGSVYTSWTQPCTISTTQIYNRALTASEVLQNYNATRGRYGI